MSMWAQLVVELPVSVLKLVHPNLDLDTKGILSGVAQSLAHSKLHGISSSEIIVARPRGDCRRGA